MIIGDHGNSRVELPSDSSLLEFVESKTIEFYNARVEISQWQFFQNWKPFSDGPKKGKKYHR